MASRRPVVFITYNGLLDPLGPSQILPYLERLNRDWPICILSYEREDKLADRGAVERMKARTASQGIEWISHRYHKWPSLVATSYDLLHGVATLRQLIWRRRPGLIHCRGYLPMSIAVNATRSTPILFDIRGLQAEEYVDGGVWKKGELKWRLAKSSERRFFRRAAGAVVLTHNIRPYVQSCFAEAQREVPVEVIPCCVDLDRFVFDEGARRARRAQLEIEDERVLFVYAGSIGTWYLPDEMARFVRMFRDRTARKSCLLWLVNNDPDAARAASQRAGLGEAEVRIANAAPGEMAGYLSAADAALALIRPSFSKRSSSPTKYAECLAVGLPLVICRDVGDGAVLEERGGAIALDAFDDSAMSAAIDRLQIALQHPREAQRKIATDVFDLDSVAMPIYRRLYERLVLR